MMPRSPHPLGMLLALLLSMAAPVMAACDPPPAATQLGDGRWQLALAPGETRMVWLIERGHSLRVTGSRGGSIEIGAPSGYALLPLVLVGDGEGHADFEVEAVDAGGSIDFELVARCGTMLMNALTDRIARERPAAIAGDAAAGLRMTALAALASVLAAPPREAAWPRLQLASLARAAGYRREAAALYAAAAAALQAHDPVRHAWARLGHAQAQLGLGDADAGDLLLSAAADADQVGLAYAAAVARHDHCLWLRTRGAHEQAVRCFDAAIVEFAALGEHREHSRALLNRATALEMLGRYAEARSAVDAAAMLQGDDPRHAALVSRHRAQLARWQGDFELALAELQSALRLLDDSVHLLDRAHTLRLLGVTYAAIGETERALGFLGQSLTIYEARGLPARAAALRVSMAGVLDAAGRPQEALALIGEAAAIVERAGTANEARTLRLELARLQTALEQRDEALATLDALAADRAAGSAMDSQVLRLRMVLSPPRDLASIERELAPVLDEATRSGHLLQTLEIAEVLVSTRLRHGADAAAGELANSALALANRLAARVRSPALRHALARRAKPLAIAALLAREDGMVSEAEAAAAMAAVEALRQRERRGDDVDADAQFEELERWLTAETLGGDDTIPLERRHALVLALDAAGAGRDAEAELQPLASLPLPRPASGEMLLYPMIGTHAAGLLIADDEGWRWQRTAASAPLRSRITALRDRLAAGHGDTAAIDVAVAELADALRWSTVLRSVPARLQIVVDGELSALPWDLLPVAADGTRLGQRSELVLLQSMQPQPWSAPVQLFTLVASPAPDIVLEPLLQGADEVVRVAGHWSAMPSTRIGAEPAALFAALARPGAVVHVAAHGRADSGLAEESGLWLGEGQAMQFVSALRLRRTPQQAQLVVLGACEGAHAVAARSLGMGGVAGALVDAGSGAVVSALWPVSDRAAYLFADAFHAALAQAPDEPAAALHRAKATLREYRAFRHPTHWAGWVLLQSGPLDHRPAVREVAP